MQEQDYEQLTLFQEDSRASHSPKLGSEEARQTTVSSGRKCSELCRTSGPLGCLVKMCLESSIWHSTRCFLTWKPQVTPAGRLMFRLAESTPRTEDTESQFLPTPTRTVHGKKPYAQGGRPLTMIYAQKFGDAAMQPEFLEWMMGYEQQFTKLIPTPIASDHRGGALNRFWNSQNVQVERERESGKVGYDGNLKSLVEVTPLGRIGYLNPEWVEWLMGYAIGWTESNASETPSSPSSSSPSSQR